MNTKIIKSKLDRIKLASTPRGCDIILADNGQWYLGINDIEGEYSDEDKSWYGGFLSEERAEKYLNDNFSNPGGWGVDDSGTRPNPKKYPKGKPEKEKDGKFSFQKLLDETKKKFANEEDMCYYAFMKYQEWRISKGAQGYTIYLGGVYYVIIKVIDPVKGIVEMISRGGRRRIYDLHGDAGRYVVMGWGHKFLKGGCGLTYEERELNK